jgi:hypothetical protein
MKDLLDASPYKKQQDEAKALVNKWDKTGLLDGLNEDFQKSGMAVMLENQARQLIQENSATGGGAGAGSAGTAGSEEWSGVALPLVRRIFGEIAAQDFVSVQPMNLPSGLVFYLDFKYGTTTSNAANGYQPEGFGTTTRGVNVPGGSVDSLGGKTGPNNPSGSSAPFGVGGLYGEGRYDYSINQVVKDLEHSLDSTLETGEFITSSVDYKDINFNQEFSASLASNTLVKVEMLKSDLAGVDEKAVRSFNFIMDDSVAADNTDIVGILPQFTKLSADGTKVSFIITGSTAVTSNAFGIGANAAGNFATGSVLFTKQPTEADRGDFEDTVGDADDNTELSIPEVDLQLKSQAIVAKTRKLKAVWSPELAQDLNAYHSVDAEAELTSMLSEYISMEIDLEILDMLISDAVTVDYWSATPGEDYDGAGGNESDWNITTFYGTRYEWYQTLLGKIQKVSNEIQRLTLRGGANFVVVSPTVATILESIPGYMVNTDGNKSQFAAGVQVAGQLQNRFTVYKNPYMTENTVLVGFRGSNFLETGAVYSPYVPLIMTPLVYDPQDFTPRKGVMTRYAKKMIRPEFYGKIHCKDLNIV